jgi:hypothetical protein
VQSLTQVAGNLSATAVALVTLVRQHRGSVEITVEWTVDASGTSPPSEKFGSADVTWQFEVTARGSRPHIKVSLVVRALETRSTEVESLETRSTEVDALESRSVRVGRVEVRASEHERLTSRAMVTTGLES